MLEFIQIHKTDNVVVVLKDWKQGDVLQFLEEQITVKNDIPKGHKIAISNIEKGNNIIKYGTSIAYATQHIQVGAHVHTHNAKTNLNENLEYTYNPVKSPVYVKKSTQTFKGYLRKNGTVGVRNELWIIPSVGCVNGQAQQIIQQLKAEQDVNFIDDIRVLSHQYGCSQLGDDHDNTKKALAAAALHPNAGGVLVLGLGCENNQIPDLKKEMANYDENRVKFLVSQNVEDEVETGLQMLSELAEQMKNDQRTNQPLSKLNIGLKCGGSDAFSGITANPLLGVFSDWLVSNGGSTILTEVPEMFGAETTLMNRAENVEVFDKTVALINSFKDYFRKNDQVIYENPSPGNKAGGITTLEEKSLGATQKGGLSKVVDVLKYSQSLQKPGLNLLWSPGNDLIASSALALSGCQIVLFTTGRGTPFGSFVPTLKISSNSTLAQKKKNWIDFNAGEILDGISIEDLNKSFSQFILDVAEGKQAKHEIANFKEIAIFKSGVTL